MLVFGRGEYEDRGRGGNLHPVWSTSGGVAQGNRLVAGKARARKRHCAELSWGRRAWHEKYCADQHLPHCGHLGSFAY